MTKQDLFNRVDHCIKNNLKAKIYPKDVTRNVIFGKFVEMTDSAEIRRKGFARFVPRGKEDLYNSCQSEVHTKMISMEGLQWIEPVLNFDIN